MVPNDVPVGSPGLALISILNKLLRSKQVFFNLNSPKKCGSQSKSHLIKQTSSYCFSQCIEVFSLSLFMMDTHGCTCNISIISSSIPDFYWLNNQVSCGFNRNLWILFVIMSVIVSRQRPTPLIPSSYSSRTLRLNLFYKLNDCLPIPSCMKRMKQNLTLCNGFKYITACFHRTL